MFEFMNEESHLFIYALPKTSLHCSINVFALQQAQCVKQSSQKVEFFAEEEMPLRALQLTQIELCASQQQLNVYVTDDSWAVFQS